MSSGSARLLSSVVPASLQLGHQCSGWSSRLSVSIVVHAESVLCFTSPCFRKRAISVNHHVGHRERAVVDDANPNLKLTLYDGSSSRSIERKLFRCDLWSNLIHLRQWCFTDVPEMSLQYIDRAKRRDSSACRRWFLDLVQNGVLVVTF